MISVLARTLRRAFGVPGRMQLFLGLLAAVLACGAAFFEISGPGGTKLSFAPAILMMAEITGGWGSSTPALVVFTSVASLLKGGTVSTFAVGLFAVLSALAMRVGARPLVPFLLLAVANIAPAVADRGVVATVSSGALAWALIASSFNVAVASALMVWLPHRGRGLAPRRRWCLEDAMFVIGTTFLVPSVLLLSSTQGGLTGPFGLWVAAACLAAHLALYFSGMLAGLRARALARLVRSGRVARRASLPWPRQARLPLEAATLFTSARRTTDGLHRLTARQGLHLESAKRRVDRLQQRIQSGERALREKELAMQSALAARKSIDAGWRAFLETVPDVLIIADSGGTLAYANGAIRQVLGYVPEDLVGTPLSRLIASTQGARDPLELNVAFAEGETERPPREVDVKFTDARGGTRELAARVQGYYLHAERRLGIRLRDVSGLRHVVRELKRARSASGSNQRARDQFIAMMSHEIRTPLHGLMATLDMLRSETFSAEGRHRLSIARTSAKTLINIANDILDLSRIDAGGMTLELKPISLERLITEVVDEARARAESMRLEVHTRVVGGLPVSVTGDPVRIKQILRNLLSNALKFTSEGGVTLQASYAGGECIIDVTDTGEGIPQDRQVSIFEPFVQAEAASSRRFGGAGLGLPISRKLSEAMGGRLGLVQSGSTGSTFRVSLPLPVTDEAPVEDQSQRILQLVQGRILVVEDDAASQYVAQTLLDSLQCSARIASSGTEAVELARGEEFDLVLMDCEMPELDGYETTRRLRQLLERHVPIIAMTASTMASDRQRCFEAGMDDILPKPFGKSALNDVLVKWLSEQPVASTEGTLEERLAALPRLDASVFEELRESLHWQLPPLRKIYASFRQSAQETVGLLSDMGTSREAQLALRRLHSLQGSAGLVGARQIEHLAAWLTQAVKDRKQDEISSALPLLRESLARFENEIDARFEAISGR